MAIQGRFFLERVSFSLDFEDIKECALMEKRGRNAKCLGSFLKKLRTVLLFNKRITIYAEFCVASL